MHRKTYQHISIIVSGLPDTHLNGAVNLALVSAMNLPPVTYEARIIKPNAKTKTIK